MNATFKTTNVSYFLTKASFSNEGVNTLPSEGFDRAEREITGWDGYAKTPLESLERLAEQLNLREIYYKDEGPRFGLGSFKALGGAYAVQCVLARAISQRVGKDVSLDDIRNGIYAEQAAQITVTSATDGNHGRSVAWGATRFGAQCRIYIHAEVSEHRAEVMRGLGAEVVRVDGDYDASVAQARREAEENGWLVVSDTSWPGYTQPPLDVMAGYGVMAREIVRDLPTPPTHVFLQGGVGGLAASVAAVFQQEWGAKAPQVIIVEPELAPCLYASGKANAPTLVEIQEETLMAGLSCGEPSELAWSVLAAVSRGFMTIPESVVAPAVRLLANGDASQSAINAGESAVAGLAGVMWAASDPQAREDFNLGTGSRVVLIGSEGVTDPNVFQQIMAGEI
ncbi:Diaminopropionate ammonia-lyase [Roseovarius albus]|uniref:Diaminopropionate ammonia-lyase n=1 Tax=Roseovarius albus TaxID=1247867 RepID=A0A1X6YKN3_9RHOB|nr:diaminopropionate ammonia-lyase [Roseovarius albus]SLN24151.1 Diaminopropionate ammonia-lyase [Roseovarius albus]